MIYLTANKIFPALNGWRKLPMEKAVDPIEQEIE